MTTVLLIIGACILVAGAVSFATGLFNSSKEEQLPIENPEVAKPTVVKNKKKSSPKQKAPKKKLEA